MHVRNGWMTVVAAKLNEDTHASQESSMGLMDAAGL